MYDMEIKKYDFIELTTCKSFNTCLYFHSLIILRNRNKVLFDLKRNQMVLNSQLSKIYFNG